MHFLLGAGEGIFSSVTSDSLMGIFNEVTSLVPIVIPVVIAFIGFRKGWGFLKSAVGNA